MPVPRPVTSAGSAPVKTAIRAADAVVFAMPISPVSRRLVACRDQVAGGLDAHLDGRARPPRGSSRGRRSCRPCPARTLRGSSPGVAGQFGGDADVDDADLGADLVGERVADRAAAEEVGHHLRGDLLRPRGDALGVHPVVAGEDRDGRGLGDRRRALPATGRAAARR